MCAWGAAALPACCNSPPDHEEEVCSIPNRPANRRPQPPPARQILSTFGDLALTLGPNFEKYVPTVKTMLQQAMQLSAAQVGGLGRLGALGSRCVWQMVPRLGTTHSKHNTLF